MIQQEDKHQPVRKDFLVDFLVAHFEISSARAKGENAYCKQRIRTAWVEGNIHSTNKSSCVHFHELCLANRNEMSVGEHGLRQLIESNPLRGRMAIQNQLEGDNIPEYLRSKVKMQ